ncbi:MAG: Enoyl-CoA hydratase/isomerase, partial [Actinomycetota bacterium]
MIDQPPFKTLVVEVEGRVGRVTLNRPEKLNALSRQLMSEIVELGAWLKLREDIRVVILS